MSKICRACLTVSKRSKHIFNGHQGRIAFMIKECTSMKVAVNDGLPASLCLACFKKLNIAFKFRELFKTNDKVFRTSLNIKQDAYEEKYLLSDDDDDDLIEDCSIIKSENNDLAKANFKCKSAQHLKSNPSPKSKESDNFNSEPDLKIPRCLRCAKDFSTKHSFLKHQREVHSEALTENSALQSGMQTGNELEEKDHFDEESTSTNKEYDCDQCDMILSTKKMLDRHMRKHIGRKRSFRSDLNNRYVEDGYEYSTSSIKTSYRYLRCASHRPPIYCLATAKIHNGKFMHINSTHNHDRPQNAEDVLHFRAAIHDMAATSTSKPKEIYDLMAVLYPIGAAQTPYRVLEASIRRWQREGASTVTADDDR